MVSFDTAAGSPTFQIKQNGSGAKWKAQIPWSQIDDLINVTFPPGSVAGPTILPGVPLQMPSFSFLYADSLDIKPVGKRITGPDTSTTLTQLPTYELAEVTITFTAPESPQGDEDPDNEDDPVPFLTHRLAVGGEWITLTGTALAWDDDGTSPGKTISPAKYVSIWEHHITWPRVVRPPFSIMRDRLGAVNDAQMSFQTGTIEPETLLFLGAELQRQIMSDGTRAWEVGYRFSERRVTAQQGAVGETDDVGGWNHFYRADSDKAGFYRLIDTTPGVNLDIYDLKSFDELFEAEPTPN